MDLIELPKWKLEVYADRVVAVSENSITLECGGVVPMKPALAAIQVGDYYVQAIRNKGMDDAKLKADSFSIFVNAEMFERWYKRVDHG